MGQLRFSGLTSGIDTTSLVKQLMAIEGRRLATYQVKQADNKKQIGALDTLMPKINALKSAAAGMSDANSLQIYTANSSATEKLAVSVSSDANTGSHSVAVNQLATADTWIQNTSSFTYETDYVGGGNFIYSYHNQQRVITAVANETTLADLVNLINTDENNPGVTASLLHHDNKYHLMLNGRETGEDFQISVDTSSTEVWKPSAGPNSTFTKDGSNVGLTAKITELDQFSGVLGASDKITFSGKNHSGTLLPDTDLAITENTTIGHLVDALNEYYDGTATARLENGQLWLTDNTGGSSGLEVSMAFTGEATLGLPTMAVSTEGGGTLATLASLSASSFIETQNAQNSKLKIDGFPAGTQNEVQTLSMTGGVPTAGTFRLTLDGKTTEAIAYNANAAAIEAALLALDGIEPGDVTAAGTDLINGTVSVTFGGALAGMDIAKMTVSDAGSMDAGVVSVVQTTQGNDGWIHRNSNTITNALAGITLNLHDVTAADAPIKVTVNRNIGTLRTKVQTMVTAYNDLVTELKSKTEYDSKTKTMGLLSRDVAASFLKTQISSPLTTIAKGFVESFDKFVQANDVGITLDGAGMLNFESSVFDAAVNESYKSVIELLGAGKIGNSSTTDIQFYNASKNYTTAGIYNVKVEVNAENQIISAKIKLADETEYRDAASWSGNVISFDSTFDDKGRPSYPEHGLQLTVDLAEGVYGTDANPVVVRVKQGLFGTLENLLDDVLKTDGQLDTSTKVLNEKNAALQAKIDKEQIRLDKAEKRLVAKYARLETILTRMQQQQQSVASMMGMEY